MENGFLPVCREDLADLHIECLDFVYVTGDAYVDHPSFAAAVISRVLVSHGYTVGIISQPDWTDPESIAILGRPRLGFLVSAGNMDSMVNHYTVARKRRSTDAYSPGGAAFRRPDRAVLVYSNLIRARYKDSPIIVGGLEASLRRMAHYDYWSDSLRRSVLMDCGADLISYGMGERSIVEIADALAAGIDVKDITFINGTCFKTKNKDLVEDCVMLPSYDELLADKAAFARSFYIQYTNTDPFSGRRLAERYQTVYVVQNPPAMPLSMQEMDDVYDLPYTRKVHPSCGEVPAVKEISFSLVSNRGCFGGCSFCAITYHQGRIVQCRSHASILAEAKAMTKDPAFKGYIHDVGGPTADFRHPACQAQTKRGACKDRQCLFPSPCRNLRADHTDYVRLLQKLRAIPGVKKVFVRSGLRFDYIMAESSDEFMEELVRYHISGQLKVAPEHVSDSVLKKMGKPPHRVYEAFVKRYERINRQCGMKQYLVPYLMSSHPGCTLKDAVILAEYLRDIHHMPEQVQDFYPTPGTLSTAMYYTGLDPRTMQKVYVPRSSREKAMQRALMQYALPANRALVTEALELAGREDLIGYDAKCLVRPYHDRQGRSKLENTRPGGKPENTRQGRKTESTRQGRKPESTRHGRSKPETQPGKPGRNKARKQARNQARKQA